jgi:ketosteroid isomerase-like protein
MNADLIAANLAAVEAHFHRELANEVEAALELYTDDIVWEAPARGLVFRGKQEVADNYRRLFSSIEGVELRNLQRFATEDRVFDDSELRFTLVREGYLPLPVGQRVQLRLAHVFELRDGKISREIAYEMWRTID